MTTLPTSRTRVRLARLDGAELPVLDKAAMAAVDGVTYFWPIQRDQRDRPDAFNENSPAHDDAAPQAGGSPGVK